MFVAVFFVDAIPFPGSGVVGVAFYGYVVIFAVFVDEPNVGNPLFGPKIDAEYIGRFGGAVCISAAVQYGFAVREPRRAPGSAGVGDI